MNLKLITALSLGIVCAQVHADTTVQTTTTTQAPTTQTTTPAMQTTTPTTQATPEAQTSTTQTTPATQNTTMTNVAISADTTAQTGKAAGEAFLSANKTKPGVTTLPDGLQYKVIKAGTGPKPTDTDVVTVKYSGKLINGTEFDSSDKHGGPAKFPVGQVIPGWVEALKMMPVGSTWEVYVPANLAYGEQGAPPSIGPNETLIFTISLLDINK